MAPGSRGSKVCGGAHIQRPSWLPRSDHLHLGQAASGLGDLDSGTALPSPMSSLGSLRGWQHVETLRPPQGSPGLHSSQFSSSSSVSFLEAMQRPNPCRACFISGWEARPLVCSHSACVSSVVILAFGAVGAGMCIWGTCARPRGLLHSSLAFRGKRTDEVCFSTLSGLRGACPDLTPGSPSPNVTLSTPPACWPQREGAVHPGP